MINSDEIFEAVRRGYTELADADSDDILDYFSDAEDAERLGNLNNIKGIVFELEVVDNLNNHGLNSALFEATNHPASDLAIFNDDEIIREIQLKATDSVSYINDTLETYPDVPIIATSEVAHHFSDNPMVIDSGLDNSYLTDTVNTTLFDPDVATEIASQATDLVSDTVDEGLSDLIEDSMLPIPISPVGLAISAITGLWGLF